VFRLVTTRSWAAAAARSSAVVHNDRGENS
jgi:hypothetical protein